MDYEEIIDVVRRSAGGLGHEAAERTVQVTLQTLAEDYRSLIPARSA